MGVIIDRSKCIGCGRCRAICPGNLIGLDDEKRAYLKCPEDCWSCISCMKECPVQAVSLVLSPAMGGSGSRLTAVQKGSETEWTVTKNGRQKVLITDTKEANKY